MGNRIELGKTIIGTMEDGSTGKFSAPTGFLFAQMVDCEHPRGFWRNHATDQDMCPDCMDILTGRLGRRNFSKPLLPKEED